MTKRSFLKEFADGKWEEGLAWHEGQHQFLSTVEMLPVEWLWNGFIPRGMVTVLTGEEGLGKSQLALKIAAEFSRGQFGDLNPDGSERPGGFAKFYTAEDPLKQVLVPRLHANRAAMSNVAAEGIRAKFTLTEKGISDMAEGIDKVGFGLIVIDPVIAYFGAKSDANKAQDVRQVMRLLAALAEETGAVIIGIAHPKKGEEMQALHKMIGGSSAFGQAARSVLGVCRHPTEDDWRVVGRLKGNLDKPPTPVAYEIIGTTLEHAGANGEDIRTSKIETRGLMPADFDFVAAIMGKEQRGGEDEDVGEKTDQAMTLLRAWLGRGPVKNKEILKRARENTVSTGRLYAAEGLLGITRETDEDGDQTWQLP